VPKTTAGRDYAAASLSSDTDQKRGHANVNANVVGFHPTNNSQKDSNDFITFVSKMATELRVRKFTDIYTCIYGYF